MSDKVLVYVVIFFMDHVYGVFSTIELARQFIKEGSESAHEWSEIQVWELDKDFQERIKDNDLIRSD